MTTDQHKNAILARIGDCNYHIAQAAAEGRREGVAMDNWQYLFETGQYRKAHAWWYAEIEPATREDN